MPAEFTTDDDSELLDFGAALHMYGGTKPRETKPEMDKVQAALAEHAPARRARELPGRTAAEAARPGCLLARGPELLGPVHPVPGELIHDRRPCAPVHGRR